MKRTDNDLKKIVRGKYDDIATKSETSAGCSCGPSCCPPDDYTVFSDDYSGLEGYVPEADLNLGCGIPTEYADIKKGDTVLDLGSGAGNDCFVARSIVGDRGKVIGIDFSTKMLEKARNNAKTVGYENVEFIESDIENIKLPDGIIDVVISNCVLNLVPVKEAASKHIFRVLKRSGHFCVSDVVISGILPEALQQDAELYAGCVSGAIQKESYLEHIRQQGFTGIEIKKEKLIELPAELLAKYMDSISINNFRSSGTGIFSITVTGSKP